VSKSDGWSYIFGGARPTFKADRPGTYTITLAADLVNADTMFPGAGHAESNVSLVATGSAKAGCRQGESTATAMALSLLVLGFGILRRRRQ